MGQPSTRHGVLLPPEHIGRVEGTRGIETSQYPEERKANATPLVVASEKGKDQTVSVQYPDGVADRGLWDVKTLHQKCHRVNKLLGRRMVSEKPAIVGKSPVFETHAISVTNPK